MSSPISKPIQIAVSKDGDLLVIQGSAKPALFVPRPLAESFQRDFSPTNAVLILDVGLAAVRTALAANASFVAHTQYSADGSIEAATLRFRFPNGLVLGYTTDETLASDTSRLRDLGIDLVVTNDTIDWQRRHSLLIGQVISAVAPVPPQVVEFTSGELAAVSAKLCAVAHGNAGATHSQEGRRHE